MSYSVDLEWPEPGVALLTFSDHARGNQICWAAIDAIAERLSQCREAGVRVAVLASGLSGHWLQHAWLRDLANGVQGEEQTGSGMGWFTAINELCHEDMISIAAISGDTSGGGAELGWACDLRVAESHVSFCQPEVDMGLTTGIGGSSRLARLAGRSTAAQVVLTGRPVSARRLYDLGVINQLVEPGQAVAVALELARELAVKPPLAVAGLKKILAHNEDASLTASLQREQEIFQSVVVTDQAVADMEKVQSQYDAAVSTKDPDNYKGKV